MKSHTSPSILPFQNPEKKRPTTLFVLKRLRSQMSNVGDTIKDSKEGTHSWTILIQCPIPTEDAIFHIVVLIAELLNLPTGSYLSMNWQNIKHGKTFVKAEDRNALVRMRWSVYVRSWVLKCFLCDWPNLLPGFGPGEECSIRRIFFHKGSGRTAYFGGYDCEFRSFFALSFLYFLCITSSLSLHSFRVCSRKPNVLNRKSRGTAVDVRNTWRRRRNWNCINCHLSSYSSWSDLSTQVSRPDCHRFFCLSLYSYELSHSLNNSNYIYRKTLHF